MVSLLERPVEGNQAAEDEDHDHHHQHRDHGPGGFSWGHKQKYWIHNHENYFLLLTYLECPQAPLLLASCLGNLSLVWINLFVWSLNHHIFSEGTISLDTAAHCTGCSLSRYNKNRSEKVSCFQALSSECHHLCCVARVPHCILCSTY